MNRHNPVQTQALPGARASTNVVMVARAEAKVRPVSYAIARARYHPRHWIRGSTSWLYATTQLLLIQEGVPQSHRGFELTL